MKIEPHVNFVLEMVEPGELKRSEVFWTGSTEATPMEALQSHLRSIHLLDLVPCAFNLKRNVYIWAQNVGVLKNNNGQDITTDSFKFIVANKVPYFADLQQYLLQNSRNGARECQDVHFQNMAQFDITQPILYNGPYEYNGSFLPDMPLNERPLTARPLTKKDIIVDRKLEKQIWPVVGKFPQEMLTILAKTKEEINSR